MGRYLVLWEMDPSKFPLDRKDRAIAMEPMLKNIKDSLKDGNLKDWGFFAGEMRGYAIYEGTEVEVSLANQFWIPYVHFTVHQVCTIKQTEELIKGMKS